MWKNRKEEKRRLDQLEEVTLKHLIEECVITRECIQIEDIVSGRKTRKWRDG